MYRYFNDLDFEKAVPSCKITDINPSSLKRLDNAREFAGIPFVVNSAYRSPEYEVSKGRSGKGAHTEGCAFDIRCTDSRSRWLVVFSALSVGFTRIGIGKTFVHLDDSDCLTPNVIWLYGE